MLDRLDFCVRIILILGTVTAWLLAVQLNCYVVGNPSTHLALEYVSCAWCHGAALGMCFVLTIATVPT